MKCFITSLLVVALSADSFGFGTDPGDVLVGRSASGQLKISPPGSGGYIPDQNIKLLFETSGLFNGWSDTEPGFDHIIVDQPDIDFYTLSPGCSIRLQVVQVDPAFQAISPSLTIIDDPGESFLLGTNTLHTHPTWLINSSLTQFDPQKVLWRATFRLVDTGSTGYLPSENFVFYFANTDCSRGDCNNDGAVDGLDIEDFVKTILMPDAFSPEQRCRADANRDGYATIDDVPEFVLRLLAS